MATASAAGTATAGGGMVLVVAITALNLSNFVFHVVVSRVIGPSSYGELGALLNIVVVLAIPLGALQAAVAQVVAERSGTEGDLGLRGLLRWAAVAAVGATAVWLALVVPVDRGLRIASPVATASLAIWVGPTVLSAVLQGALLGERRFRTLAVTQFVGGGVVRLIAAVVLTRLGLGVTGAVLATPLSGLATCGMLLFATRSTVLRPGGLRMQRGDAFRSVAGLGGATLLTSIDAWMARYFLPPAHAGFFAAASTAGRISLFLPGAITTVVFPSMAATSGRGPEARAQLLRSGGLVVGVSLLAAAVLALVPDLVVSVLFGDKFASAAPILPIIALADAGIAVVSLLVYFFLARRSRWSVSAWGSCLVALALGAAFHRSGRMLAYDMLATNLGTAVALGVVALRSVGRRTGEERHEPHPPAKGSVLAPVPVALAAPLDRFAGPTC
jgi:O-antigen/teichoic acid export membrane protein